MTDQLTLKPVAWQTRHRVISTPMGQWTAWTPWRDGRAACLKDGRTWFGQEHQERPLFAGEPRAVTDLDCS